MPQRAAQQVAVGQLPLVLPLSLLKANVAIVLAAVVLSATRVPVPGEPPMMVALLIHPGMELSLSMQGLACPMQVFTRSQRVSIPS